jgi:hypothetical protein
LQQIKPQRKQKFSGTELIRGKKAEQLKKGKGDPEGNIPGCSAK